MKSGVSCFYNAYKEHCKKHISELNFQQWTNKITCISASSKVVFQLMGYVAMWLQ